MEGDVGLQVAVPEGFAYGGAPFRQFQFLPSKGFEYGSKQVDSSLSPGDDSVESGTGLQSDSRGWEGFSFLSQIDSCQNNRKRDHCLAADVRLHNDTVTAMDLRLDSRNNKNVEASMEQRRKQSLFNSSATQTMNLMRTDDSLVDDAGSLALKLCPGPFSNTEDVGNCARNTKRVRPSSPGNQSPVCQVDDCHADLKNAKDYHRRHKVCEHHSKAPQSLVHNVMQRFCQQCSRFHPLQEFDEGKRSCRRRLAGHNKRRRKTHTDNGASSVTLTDAARGADLLNLVALLQQLQAKPKEKQDVPNLEQDVIIQALKQAALVQPLTAALLRDATSLAARSMHTIPGTQKPDQGFQLGGNGSLAGFSQEALLLALQNVLGAQLSVPPAKMPQPQFCQQQSNKEQHIQTSYSNGHSSPGSLLKAPENVIECLPFLISGKSQSIVGNGDVSELSSKSNIRNQHMGYNASDSVETEPDSSPESNGTQSPTEQKFFPTESCNVLMSNKGKMHDTQIHLRDGYNIHSFASHTRTSPPSVKPTGQRSDSSETGSDQSPSSSSSGSQDLSGRIFFKLCDPNRIADIPQSYRSELQKWLSVTPLFMEDYMRPGCVLLTVFVSMPHHSWEELVLNLRGSLKRLIRMSHDGIWSKGRVLVQVEQQRALIVNGKVKKIRFSKATKGPLLKSARPLAVVAGEESTLSVSGYNLFPHTKIICVYNGRYILHDLSLGSDQTGLSTQTIHFPGGPPNVFGRFFVEVERDFLGNTLPVIVADKEICNELISLEKELDFPWESKEAEDFSSDDSRSNKEADALNFLHELGWIFQSTSFNVIACSSLSKESSQIILSRFKGLLKFSVLHDWCALVKKLLDILFTVGVSDVGNVLQVLSEVHLVHQAVKRRCRAMIELLLLYKPNVKGVAHNNVFTPIMSGPAGFTPLHVAASMRDAEDVLEALTNDPCEDGLRGWKSAVDYAGHSPEWHAQNSGNSSYVQLIERKMLRKQSPSVNITILDHDKIEGFNACVGKMVPVTDNCTKLIERPSFSRPVPVSAQPCRSCRAIARASSVRLPRAHIGTHRPLLMMMVAVAAVCATVTLFLKTPPHLESIFYSLKWEGIGYGSL